MKAYIVYVDGKEVGVIRAGSHNAAERKAQTKYKCPHGEAFHVSVAYTEL